MATPVINSGAEVIYTTGGAGGGGIYGPPGTNGLDYKLVTEKLEEWQWFQNFLDQNSDVKERYAVHKTYEILNNDNQK